MAMGQNSSTEAAVAKDETNASSSPHTLPTHRPYQWNKSSLRVWGLSIIVLREQVVDVRVFSRSMP